MLVILVYLDGCCIVLAILQTELHRLMTSSSIAMLQKKLTYQNFVDFLLGFVDLRKSYFEVLGEI